MENQRESTIDKLVKGNSAFLRGTRNSGKTSRKIRRLTAEHGQAPYAVVVTCSDSRVVPEHIFNAGIGELFVIENAGNIISDFALGSIEYGVEHLGIDAVIVMGHTGCGAVAATIHGGAHGYIKKNTDEIKDAIGTETDCSRAEVLNVEYSIKQIMRSEVITKLVAEGKATVKGAIYHTHAGNVEFL